MKDLLYILLIFLAILTMLIILFYFFIYKSSTNEKNNVLFNKKMLFIQTAGYNHFLDSKFELLLNLKNKTFNLVNFFDKKIIKGSFDIKNKNIILYFENPNDSGKPNDKNNIKDIKDIKNKIFGKLSPSGSLTIYKDLKNSTDTDATFQLIEMKSPLIKKQYEFKA